jgi:HD-GYP domain-containing protein (c-di-GMP phosphodiesterase class II)
MALVIRNAFDVEPKIKTDISEFRDIIKTKDLLVTHIKIDIKRNSHFTVFPEEGKTEFFFLYKGKLKSKDGQLINEGDFVTYNTHEDMLLLENCEILSVEVTKPTYIDQLISPEAKNKYFALAVKIDEKDPYTYGHCNRIRLYSLGICKELSIFKDGTKDFLTLEEAAYIHDIGKVKLPLDILNKNSKLTVEEFDEMKKHSTYGKELLMVLPGFEKHALIIEQHHEKLDGTGYPNGIKDILIEAQIITVADIFDALTTKRTYKPAMPVDKAFEILKREPINQDFVSALERYIGKYSIEEQLV